jgi:hypothetical protein
MRHNQKFPEFQFLARAFKRIQEIESNKIPSRPGMINTLSGLILYQKLPGYNAQSIQFVTKMITKNFVFQEERISIHRLQIHG